MFNKRYSTLTIIYIKVVFNLQLTKHAFILRLSKVHCEAKIKDKNLQEFKTNLDFYDSTWQFLVDRIPFEGGRGNIVLEA